MEHWNEIRTAYQVARLGTVSAAAEFLDVHRATVIRHIDALEAALGDKIFQRHSRGYTPTEVGLDLMRVAKATDEQFSQWVGRTKGRKTELSGEFVVTSLYVVAPMLMPVLQTFQRQYPGILVRYLASDRLFQLEYGEAHVAVRTGPKPDQPDIIAQPFSTIRMGLYASAAYISCQGMPKTLGDFANHQFVGPNRLNSLPPFDAWMRDHVPKNRIVFRSNSRLVMELAALSGAGIAFLPSHKANQHPDLIEVWPHKEEWDIPFWLITHVDFHQTAKVQTFLKFWADNAAPKRFAG